MILSEPHCPSIFVTNTQSIFPKFDELRLSVATFRVDMSIVTEAWLHDKLDDKVLS